jgi:hypothetical protein
VRTPVATGRFDPPFLEKVGSEKSIHVGWKSREKNLWFPIYMQSERRDLEYFGKGLTDEQVVEKKRALRESAQAHPEIAEYFRELAVDFCVRFPEEATKQRETKEWEQLDSAFSPKTMAALNNEYNESHNP